MIFKKRGIKPGDQGEQLAARHLKKQGYRLLHQNHKTRRGEIDIIALTPGRKTLVVVEVKTAEATSDRSYLPEWRVDFRKQKQLVSLAATYARQYRYTHLPIRFDVIGITLGNPADLRHIVAAFESHV